MTRTFLPDFSTRARTKEWMDDPTASPEDVAAALRDLERINVRLRVIAALTRHLFPMLERATRSPLLILDIGTGAADIPRAIVTWARRRRRSVRIVALDRGVSVLHYARQRIATYPEIVLVRADALQLPFPPQTFDFVLATEFLHHLEEEQIPLFLRRCAELAREAFMINDLRRHPISYYGFRALTRLVFRSRLVRHDGPISILRGFTRAECEQWHKSVDACEMTVHCHFPYRLVVIGRRSCGTSSS